MFGVRRPAWVLVHRVLGLSVAGFLFISGTTGALISWDRELDEWLNKRLFTTSSRGDFLDPYEMARSIEGRYPHASVIRIPLLLEQGRSALFLVSPRVDPETSRPFELDYNEIYLDPVTGAELGRRDAGKLAFDREHLLAFLYAFHHTLLLPDLWGIDRWGQWLMGGVALIWFLDCFVGFYLTLPRRQRRPAAAMPAGASAGARSGWWARWRKSWAVRRRHGRYRLIFDLHRAAGLWTWLLLATLAFSAASLNLYPELVRPVLLAFSAYQRSADDIYPRRPRDERVVPKLGFARAAEIAAAEAKELGWPEPINRIFYAERSGYYTASFFRRTDYLAVDGMPHKRLYLDGDSGQVVSMRMPWEGSDANVFRQAQFPIHSGRILGLPGRILVSVMGLVVAALSVTGVVIWWRKRAARTRRTRTLRGRTQEGMAAAE